MTSPNYVLFACLLLLAVTVSGQQVTFGTYPASSLLVVSYSTPDGSSFQQSRYQSNASITISPALNTTGTNPANFSAAATNDPGIFTESNPFNIFAQSVDFNNRTTNASGAWQISSAVVRQANATIGVRGIGSLCRQGGNIVPINCPANLTCRFDNTTSFANPDLARRGVCVPTSVSTINLVDQFWDILCSQTFFTGSFSGPDFSTLLADTSASMAGTKNSTSSNTQPNNFVDLSVIGAPANASFPETYSILSANMVGQANNGTIWIHVEGTLVAGLSNQATGPLFPLEFSLDITSAPAAAPLPVARNSSAPVVSGQAYPGLVETYYLGTALVTVTPAPNVTYLNQSAVNGTGVVYAPNTTVYSVSTLVDVYPSSTNSSLTIAILSPASLDNSASDSSALAPAPMALAASSSAAYGEGVPASLLGAYNLPGFDAYFFDILAEIASALESFSTPPAGFLFSSDSGWNVNFNGSQVTGVLVNESDSNVFASSAINCTDLGPIFGTVCSEGAAATNFSPGTSFTATLLQNFFGLQLQGTTVDGSLNFQVQLGAYAVDTNATCAVPGGALVTTGNTTGVVTPVPTLI